MRAIDAGGRFPFEGLVTRHDFGQIRQAADDLLAGPATEPVLRP